jgi:hypothetical protein
MLHVTELELRHSLIRCFTTFIVSILLPLIVLVLLLSYSYSRDRKSSYVLRILLPFNLQIYIIFDTRCRFFSREQTKLKRNFLGKLSVLHSTSKEFQECQNAKFHLFN